MFNLTKEQMDLISKWKEEHDNKVHKSMFRLGRKYTGAIGGDLTYEFTPTSIGVVQKVRCACGEKLDVTDYKDW